MSGDREAKRLEEVFRAYESDDRVLRRWARDNVGNIRVERERGNAIRQLLLAEGLWPPAGYRILDLGCGRGSTTQQLISWGSDPRDVVGIDLLGERLEAARGRNPQSAFLRSDASQLCFRDNSFRLVMVFTVFSSILNASIAAAVSREIDRVLVPGGVVLWYDFRVRRPSNPNTRRMRRQHVMQLFPGYAPRIRSVTLVPQIARRLGRALPFAYPALASTPFLRTHLVGTLKKPEPG